MARILVIEDDPINVEAAKASLIGHDVTIAQTIQEAFDIFCDWRWSRGISFDIVMTDVHMPRGDFGGVDRHVISHSDSGNPESLPAGMAFALAAANLGAKVAILSDRDHHKDWISALLDLITAESDDGKSLIQAFFAPKPKNWGLAYVMLSGERPDSSENYVTPLTKNQ